MRGSDEQFQIQFAMPRMHVFILCVWPNDEFVRDILALYGGDFDELKEKHALMDEATKRTAIAMLYECSKQNGEQEMGEDGTRLEAREIAMGKESSVQWCHSSANWQMGCEGCELWNKDRRICYAGNQTVGLAGKKGWPDKFEEPKLFLERVEPTLKWGNPTDQERDAKPWIPRDIPRLIFLNDMGDTFSAKLPLNWMAPLLPRMREVPHQFLVLTKRPTRLVEFADKFELPPNLWIGTSVTSAATAGRVAILRKVQSGGPKFVSFEPLWSDVPEELCEGIQWAVFGGESRDKRKNPNPTEFRLEYLQSGMAAANRAGAKVFVKQFGHRVTLGGIRLPMYDDHNGDWDEWPDRYRVREFPAIPKPAKQMKFL